MSQRIIWCIIGAFLMTQCQKRIDHGDKKVIRFNMSSGLISLDPAFSKDQTTMWMCNQLYNGLVQLDDSLRVLPAIAKSYFISEDGLQYTFILRDDVFFHDHPIFEDGKGRKVVADDFVYSFNRIVDAQVASPGAWLFNGKISDSNPFKALNDSTFVMNLKIPFRPMLSLLTLQYCSVVPKEIVDHYGKDFRNIAIGTGPFQLVKWQEQVALVFKKNENYFEQDSLGVRLPYIDGVRVSFLIDRGVEFLQFLQGGFDFVVGIDKSFRDKAVDAKGELKQQLVGQIEMIRTPYVNTEYLGISMKNLQNESLSNKKVRQAINYAIDREKLITYLRNGIGIPAYHGIIPKGVNGFDASVKGYDYQPERSKQLLEEAGYPGGKGLGEIILHSNPMYQDLTEYIAKNLEDVGFQIKVQLAPGSFLRESMAKNTVDFFRASWIGDYPDAENFLALFYSQNTAPPNYTFFKNEKFDQLYLEAMSAKTDEEAFKLYAQLDQIMLNEAPIVPLFYDELIRFTNGRVEYLSTNTMNLLNLKTAKLRD